MIMFRVTDAQGKKNFTGPNLYKKVKVIIGSENYRMLLMQTTLRAKPQSFFSGEHTCIDIHQAGHR